MNQMCAYVRVCMFAPSSHNDSGYPDGVTAAQKTLTQRLQ